MENYQANWLMTNGSLLVHMTWKSRGRTGFRLALISLNQWPQDPVSPHALVLPSVVIALFSGPLWWHLTAPGSGHHYCKQAQSKGMWEAPQTPQLTSPLQMGVRSFGNYGKVLTFDCSDDYSINLLKITELYTSKWWISWYVSYTSIEQTSLTSLWLW